MIVIVLSVLFLVWFLLLRPRQGGHGAPPMVTATTSIPIVGVIIEFFSSPHTMIKRCVKDYGPVFTVPIFHKRLTYLVGPEAQEIFFKASDDVLSQQEVYDFMRPVFGRNVVYDASKKNRQVQFQTMANGLRTNRLKSYVAKIEEETRKYLKTEWGDKSGQLDLLTALSELTILTASRCLHGDDVRQHIFKDVQKIYHDLDQGVTPLTVFWPNAPTEAHKKRNAARAHMVSLFSKVIQQRKENPERSDGTDILSMFADIKYKDGSSVSDDQVTGLLIALLFAGQHTSCITSTWTSLFIANKNLSERALEEQKKVLGSDWKTKSLDFEDVQGMDFLHNCMREALRLCPTFIMILRRAEKDISINVKGRTYNIPKGDFVIVSPTVSMRLKGGAFENPDEFEPDRFAEPREEHKKTPYSYLGFGGGLHSCMGQNFAFVQVKTIISILLREYEIEMVSDKLPELGYDDMVVGPKGDCRIRYRKRDASS